eukprot:TRINITY_DN31025_c0_g1_i1.p2 TRINITY_DN31025_c0_g1~~TRINITY_DN31025_c0_g1_i1.p2  ORF type:complete len:210 (+),score=43.23 TRINITY_DN31025_c0_g1_i1:51-632(+)
MRDRAAVVDSMDSASVVTADEMSSVDQGEGSEGDEVVSGEVAAALQNEVSELGRENKKLKKRVAALEKENAELRAFYTKHTGMAPGGVVKPLVPVPAHKPPSDSMRRLKRSLVPLPSPTAMERLTDSMMAELAATVPFLPIKKIAPQIYTLDTPYKKHKVTVHSGSLVVRLGCGYEDVLTFLEKRAKIVRPRV